MKPEILFEYEYWGNHVFPSSLNMALEEFLLNRVACQKKGRKFAALRFYSFPRDSIVLGYAQDTDVLKNMAGEVDLTRRITGGSHVQTGQNVLAYSFVVPRDGNFHNFEEMRAYYASLVARALESLGVGPIDVDNKASTLKLEGRIIASHAMFWGVRSALLHGIVILQPYDVDKIAERLVLRERKIGNKIYSEYSALKKLPALSLELLKRRVRLYLKPDFLRGIVAKAILKEATSNRYSERKITDRVLKESSVFFEKRYGIPLWIKNHQPTFTEEEAEAIPGEELSGPLKKNLGYCLFSQTPDEDFKYMADPI